jgi:hypothetical protein
MTNPSITLAVVALCNTWTDLLLMEPVIFVSYDIINTIIPDIEIQTSVDKNICIAGVFSLSWTSRL